MNNFLNKDAIKYFCIKKTSQKCPREKYSKYVNLNLYIMKDEVNISCKKLST